MAELGAGGASRAARRLPWSWAVFVLVVAALLVVAQSGLGERVLAEAGIARRARPYLELYFLDAGELPSSLPRSGALGLRFAVASSEPSPRTLQWHATAIEPSGPTALDGGRLRLAPRSTRRLGILVHLSCGGASRVEVRIGLSDSAAHLSLWLTCPRPPS